jgi:RNA polymerase sigma-70 factor (ECF subfamily)
MYQIALNLCRDQLRKRRRWSRILTRRETLPEQGRGHMVDASAAEEPDRMVERREKSEAVRLALQQIPADQREVLVLKEFQGMKFREIAAILDCPESTVKSRMYYGLNGVREILTRNGIREP